MKVYNVSTGKLIKGGTSKATGSVLSMTLDSTSGGVWVADSKGSMFYFIINTATGRLQRSKRYSHVAMYICMFLDYKYNVNYLLSLQGQAITISYYKALYKQFAN